MYWVYDIETYRSPFTFSIIRADGKFKNTFEVSHRKNEIDRVLKCLDYLRDNGHVMVGFNNIGFDYPVLHRIASIPKSKLSKDGLVLSEIIFDIAQEQINSMREERFGNTIKESEWIVPQVDLFKIHHFDNKARSTSLKALEFNMRSETIEDLPYDFRTRLNDDQIDNLIKYNEHDVAKTLDFFNASKEQIRFREELTKKYGRNFMNHNDTKIGKDYFTMRLEEEGVQTYKISSDGRKVPNQTKRSYIFLKDCVFDYYDFQRPEFKSVLEWFKFQKIKETKGVFTDVPEHRLGEVAKYAELTTKRKKFKGEPSDKDIALFKEQYPCGWVEEVELKSGKNKKSYWMNWRVAENLNVVVNGFRFDFGTGGIHGSVDTKIVRENKKWMIMDADVASMYPNIAIANEVYPKHLGQSFCRIYKDVYEQRKSYAKGTAENAMLKLALNGVYGDSNNQYSIFYDSQYTMSITVNGQLSLCLLAERLLNIPECKIVQVNTDGVTVAIPRKQKELYDEICKGWEQSTGLQLEFAEYSKMFIRDVNNYIALYTNGKVKYKGAYVYEGLEWHKDHSALIVPMVAAKHMIEGVDIGEFIRNHKNKFDFMLKAKVPRSSKLVLDYCNGIDYELQNTIRYYVSNEGAKLVKVMPALESKEDSGDRRIGINREWNVKVCNDMKDYDGDLNYDFYISEAKKLVIPDQMKENNERPA